MMTKTEKLADKQAIKKQLYRDALAVRGWLANALRFADEEIHRTHREYCEAGKALETHELNLKVFGPEEGQSP